MYQNNNPIEFVSDEQLLHFSRILIEKVQLSVSRVSSKIHKNVIDPFSATFDAMRQNITLDEWMNQEGARQIQKTLQNYIGDFHESIIGCIKGWEKLGVGNSIDLRNRDKQIIAEIKNKHNTMNSSSQLAIYDKLQRHLDYDESK